MPLRLLAPDTEKRKARRGVTPGRSKTHWPKRPYKDYTKIKYSPFIKTGTGKKGMLQEQAGAPGGEKKLHDKSMKRLNELQKLKSREGTRMTSGAQRKRKEHLQSGGYKAGGRAGYAVGSIVKGAAKGAKKLIGQLKKDKGIVYAGAGAGGWELGKKTSKKMNKKASGGRANFRGGGRTRLLEELGRVEAEPSNRNRRAEVSRIHGELNRGYKAGGQAVRPISKHLRDKFKGARKSKGSGLPGGGKSLREKLKDLPKWKVQPKHLPAKKAKGGRIKGPNRPRPQGPHMWVRGDKRKRYSSGGAVLKGKKVGIQIK